MLKTAQQENSEYSLLAAAIFYTALCILVHNSALRVDAHDCKVEDELFFIPWVSLRLFEFLSPSCGLQPPTGQPPQTSDTNTVFSLHWIFPIRPTSPFPCSL